MREKRVEHVRLRCGHWGCDISAAMCAARQHVGKHGWRGERYAFKPVPKDEYCMSGKCPQGLRVRKYMEEIIAGGRPEFRDLREKDEFKEFYRTFVVMMQELNIQGKENKSEDAE